MLVGDLNLLIFFYFLIFFSLCLNVNTSLHLLLTAEILWITLYCIALFIGFIYDNINILSLTLFFLILSAIEFGIGLIILLIQNLLLRSISLNENDLNFTKFTNRLKKKLYLNRINWFL